ncbi:hypothetical protein BN1708_016999, partial [Verticillium longisporum]
QRWKAGVFILLIVIAATLLICTVIIAWRLHNNCQIDESERVAASRMVYYLTMAIISTSWHGEFVSCMPPRDTGELSAEEQASIDYLKLHSTPCPTCAAPAQKTHGCNHMICFRCNSHFCYLCSAWLDPAKPYQHFNEQPGGKRTSCYMRLWELEEGDGDDVGYGFAGGAGGDQAAVQPPPA